MCGVRGKCAHKLLGAQIDKWSACFACDGGLLYSIYMPCPTDYIFVYIKTVVYYIRGGGRGTGVCASNIKINQVIHGRVCVCARVTFGAQALRGAQTN